MTGSRQSQPKNIIMITKEELKGLYDSQLKQKLSGLENMRKKLRNKIFLSVVIIVFPIVFLISVIDKIGESNFAPLFFILVIALVIYGIILIFKNKKSKREYRSRYKNEVVHEIVKAIDPDWIYSPTDRISENEYWQSDLFRHQTDRYKGDDLISGQIEKTDFRCSELHTEYKQVTTDEDGKREERWVTIFKGLFFHADFNKNIKEKTYIEPDTAERLFGKFGQKLQTSSKGKLVKLENPEFEKIFAVFSTSQTEARYILTPAIMEALVNIYKQYKRKMHLSFIDSRVYCALSFSKDLFEPKIFSSGVKFEDVEFMYNLFLLNATIIRELNLNTRIWTKE